MQVIFWVQNRGRGKMISGGWRAEGIGHNWHRKSEVCIRGSRRTDIWSSNGFLRTGNLKIYRTDLRMRPATQEQLNLRT